MALIPAGSISGQLTNVTPFIGVTGRAQDDLRTRQLTGLANGGGILLRSFSRSVAAGSDSVRWRLAVIQPEMGAVYNSALPYSFNDGPLRAARGLNIEVTAGLDLRAGPVRLILAPQFLSEQNLAFQTIPYPQGPGYGRSDFANPLHPLPESIDLPERFGEGGHRYGVAGQSSLTVNMPGVATGVSTENIWWGPGIRNALVLSDNAAGFPHVFARPREPWRTAIGSFDSDVVVGRLRESAYFDTDSSNDTRTVTAFAITWRNAGPPGLELGAARLHMSEGANNDQMTSLFGRWVIPAAHFELYAEWGRFQDPTSLRDFLELPAHTSARTLGFQWTHPLRSDRMFRLQAEVSNLEPDGSFFIRRVPVTYTSAVVPQGFTERGEMLGPAIGPGSSSQWIAGDVLHSGWQVGVFAGRIRYDNGTVFEPWVPQTKLPDVTLLTGVRAVRTLGSFDLSVELTDATRLDYLFQGYIIDTAVGNNEGVDIRNRSLKVFLSPAVGR